MNSYERSVRNSTSQNEKQQLSHRKHSVGIPSRGGSVYLAHTMSRSATGLWNTFATWREILNVAGVGQRNDKEAATGYRSLMVTITTRLSSAPVICVRSMINRRRVQSTWGLHPVSTGIVVELLCTLDPISRVLNRQFGVSGFAVLLARRLRFAASRKECLQFRPRDQGAPAGLHPLELAL